jgi:quercetin 2,3-dioxygenase
MARAVSRSSLQRRLRAEVPASYNGFLYPFHGQLLVDGGPPERLSVGQIGWLESGGASTTVRLTAGQEGSRVMLYAGERQDVPIVTHGPFARAGRTDARASKI